MSVADHTQGSGGVGGRRALALAVPDGHSLQVLQDGGKIAGSLGANPARHEQGEKAVGLEQQGGADQAPGHGSTRTSGRRSGQAGCRNAPSLQFRGRAR